MKAKVFFDRNESKWSMILVSPGCHAQMWYDSWAEAIYIADVSTRANNAIRRKLNET